MHTHALPGVILAMEAVIAHVMNVRVATFPKLEGAHLATTTTVENRSGVSGAF